MSKESPFVRLRKPWRMDEQYKPLRDHFLRERDAWLRTELCKIVPDSYRPDVFEKTERLMVWLKENQIHWKPVALRLPDNYTVVMELELWRGNTKVFNSSLFQFPITHDGNMDPVKLAQEACPSFNLERN